MDDQNELPIPTLMRAARGAYARSIRAHLHAIGIDDLPRNGTVVLFGLDPGDGSGPELPEDLDVTEQAVSQLVETLVQRGYLDRSPDADDRRRIALTLTPRGREAVDAIVRGVDSVDLQLKTLVSPGQIEEMRAGLRALAQIKTASVAAGTGRRRPARQLRRFSPIFPVADLTRALAHYEDLGFHTFAYDDAYGFANRDGVSLHLATGADDDPATAPGSTYLDVLDADDLYDQWTGPGIAGHTEPVVDTPYQLREGSHTDPDGNLIRFGSPEKE